MIHVRHAAAAIASGLCETVLITHGESGRSGVGRTRNIVAPTSLAGQFEQPYGPMGPPSLFTIPVLRYMKTYGLTHEQLAMVDPRRQDLGLARRRRHVRRLRHDHDVERAAVTSLRVADMKRSAILYISRAVNTFPINPGAVHVGSGQERCKSP